MARTKRLTVHRPRAALPLVALLCAAPLAAQQQAAQTPPPAPPPDPELIFEREVFSYPVFQRRNPFRALVGDDAGPRFEQLQLRAVIYIPGDPSQSLAMLSLRSAAAQQLQQQIQQQVQQQETALVPDTLRVLEDTQRLRIGQSWGNVRLVQIQPDHVVLDVTEFGMTEQRILRMPIGGP